MFSMFSGIISGGGGSTPQPKNNPSSGGKLASGNDGNFVEPKKSDIDDCVRTITTSENPEQVVNAVRRLAEVVVYAEQRHIQPILDAFFERDVVRMLRGLVVRKDTPMDVQVQCLQTFSILAQSLRDEVNLFQFLSQDHINILIEHPFDFSNGPEELLAHYISLLKTVALRLDSTFCQFFYNINTRPDVFPLYDKAVSHFASSEPLVRASVRSVILMVHRVDDASLDSYVARRIDYFEEMCAFIRDRFVNLRELIAGEEFSSNWLSKVDAGMSDVLDDFSFLHDILTMREQRKSAYESFLNVFHSQILSPLLGDPADYVNLLGLAQCCLAVKNPVTLQFIYDGTFGGVSSLIESNLSHKDDRVVLATLTLAFFFVDQIEGEESFLSRKKRLNMVRGNADDSMFVSPETPARKGKSVHPTEDGSAAKTEQADESIANEVEVTKDSIENQEESKQDLAVEPPPKTALISTLTEELEQRTKGEATARPVLIRLLCKLLVHICFDSRLLDSSDLFLSVDDAARVQRAMASVSTNLLAIINSKIPEETSTFVEAFEDEWRELKSGPLRVSALVTNPTTVLPNVPPPDPNSPNQEKMDKLLALLVGKVPLAFRRPADPSETTRALANIYMVLRLCRVSLERMSDLYFPAVGNADVDSITEGAAFNLRKCEFLEARAWLAFKNQFSEKLLMVIVSGACLLVAPDNELRVTGVCRSVAPIHRIEVRTDSKDPALLHLSIKSSRRIGLSSKVSAPSTNEYLLSLQFDGEPRAGFAQEQIRRAAARARSDKLKRIREMLEESREA